VILLSLALVVATAATLAWGVFASSDPLIWVSLAAGVGAVASVAGSVVRHRRRLAPEAVPDAGQPPTGSTAVGAASAGPDPAPSPTPSRPAPSAPAPPTAGPVSAPGASQGVEPDTQPGTQPATQAGTQPATQPDTQPGTQPATQPATQPDTQPATQPGAQPWPWSTPPPGSHETGPRRGWTGPVPVPPPPADEPAAQVAAGPQAPADEESAPPAAEPEAPPADEAPGEPRIEQVAVRDALRVAQLDDEVLVVDGHPRYHLAGCPTLAGTGTIPLAVSAARRGGFTPCAMCNPDATLLARSRDRTRQKAHQAAEGRTAERPSDEGQQL
jgi:hypothetical protein